MAPKKQADASDPGFLAMRAFKRAVESANFRLGIENLSLSLDPGEGFTAVSKLVVTAMTTSNTGRPATPTHMVALAEALGPYPYMKNLAFWTVDVRDEGAKALAQYVASNRTLVRLELMNCGLGVAACKFLHDRSDYKSGWQLDKMWEEEQKELRNQEALVALGEAEAAKKTDPADHLPFACLICREPWHAGSHPVQTKCEHYFCERCAIEHFQKSRRCFACSEQTGGVFNKAKAIQEKIDRLKAVEEVASAEDMTQEQLNAEYEASKESSKRRGYTGGWGYVG